MNPQIRARLAALGTELSPALIEGTQRMFAESWSGLAPDTLVERDCAYGPHERHRLDVFSAAGRRAAPVLLFVHGGGFVMGDKRSPDLPYYDNIGDFAVRNGWVGVTMTYRLAPAHPWPAGSEDVASAIAWLHANIAAHGGDPRRIVLMGQSAGAVHAAGYVAHARFHAANGPGLAGAILVSGIYDVAAASVNQFHLAYYGEDRAAWPACSTLEGLVGTDLPLMLSVSEFDGADFQRQAAAFVSAYAAAHGRFAPLHWLPGHNHLSPVLAIGSPGETLGPLIRSFVTTVCAEHDRVPAA